MDTKIDTIIVGAGQAGLSLSYYLEQADHEHVLLEKSSQPVDTWRNRRWDSFTLVTPNWSFQVPGAEYDGPDPSGYMNREEIVERFDGYISRNAFPVHCGVMVSAIEAGEKRTFVVRTEGGDTWRANQVAIATGSYQSSKIPAFAAAIPASVTQLESWQYRNPQALAPGAILVVGSGQSGAQIAEELYQAGRKVYLSIGSAPQAPRRYRGRDLFDWLILSGFFDRTADMLPSPEARRFTPPIVTGKNGGHALNLHRFYRDGVILLGHVIGFEEGRLLLAPDMQECLALSEQRGANLLKMFDEYIQKNDVAAPPAEEEEPLRDAYAAPEIPNLNLQAAGISTILWAPGYRCDLSFARFPVLDTYGYPITRGGVSAVPGLYFVGQPWMDQLKTSFLVGVGKQAAHVAEAILAARQEKRN